MLDSFASWDNIPIKVLKFWLGPLNTTLHAEVHHIVCISSSLNYKSDPSVCCEIKSEGLISFAITVWDGIG